MLNRSQIATAALLAICYLVPASAEEELNGHAIRLDSAGKLLPWVTPEDKAYDRVIRLAWDFLLTKVPTEKNGLKSFYSYCCLDRNTMHGTAWPHNPAFVNASLADGAVAYYAYSGDRAVVKLVKDLLDYQLAHGTTPATWTWGSVPYASANHGDIEYRGAFEFQYGQPGQQAIGDGYGVIEPDKVGELGSAYLKFWKLTGEPAYRDAAISCANALARNVRPGGWGQSPWPFRVYAETGRAREEYSSNTIGAIQLFDDLGRLGLGDTSAYKEARRQVWEWTLKYPMRNMLWSGLFEDVYLQHFPNNLNQYSPMETVRYLMEHPELDPEWKHDAQELIRFVERTFVVDTRAFSSTAPLEPAVQWGANTVSEQVMDMNKMGSHTSRYASVLALWSENTGDAEAKEKAHRSLNWASYMCRDDGFVHVGPVDQSLWFSDGYGDYIRHFLAAMGAVPEWAPNGEDHILRSTSVVKKVEYAADRVSYSTFDKAGTEVLRLKFEPRNVAEGASKLTKGDGLDRPGWTFDPVLKVVRVRHANSGYITIR
jgi:hypothetical protein